MKMNKKIKYAAVIILIFGAGFLAGMEYKALQIRDAIQSAFSTNATATTENSSADTQMEKAKEEELVTITKAIGDELVMATGNVTVTNIEEKQSISSSYSSPKVAKEGAKFVVVTVEITNTTDSTFIFFPDDVFFILDGKNREYDVYNNTIGSIDNYMDSRELAPDIKETGVIVYELPSDATRYSLVTQKAGTKELYKIVLK